MQFQYDNTQWTDRYFMNSQRVVKKYGDKRSTYAIFMRRPVICAPRLALEMIVEETKGLEADLDIQLMQQEGQMIGAGEPIMYITGGFRHLVTLETRFLQLLGPACVAAWNAWSMCASLPKVAFLAMDARHCAGLEMANIMAYAASVGSKRAQELNNAVGFVGNATDATAHWFGNKEGMGTMPHALIGYAGSTLEAARMFHATMPSVKMTVLVDYFGKEITDSLEVCKHFPKLAESGQLALRVDTGSGRFVEGLDSTKSYDVLAQHAPEAIRSYRSEEELRHLVGQGVSAATLWHLRATLDNAGFPNVRIVASSGFGPIKCQVMALANVPINTIGTGSYLPHKWPETYATADIVAWDGIPRVKKGREFLLQEQN